MINGYAHTRLVTINGIPLDPAPSQHVYNHSPDGFSWGYGGSGPAQLALALLLFYTNPKYAVANYQQFKFDVLMTVAQDADFSMPVKRVREWCAAHGYEDVIK